MTDPNKAASGFSGPGLATGTPDADVSERREGEYRVTLPDFEGPLDLLLHLIQEHKLDIATIPMAFITEKYLAYLDLMKNLAIDVASEYLVMAATLVHIKSKTLLPAPPTDQDDELDEDGMDPREELIRRLLEYQKYKQAAADLGDRGALGRDVFLRGVKGPEPEGPAPLAPMGVFGLLDAFAKVLARAKVEIDHEVAFDRLSITERIQQLCTVLEARPQCRFDDLFEGIRTRFDLVITFLALLEMTRIKMTRVYQVDAMSEIHVELAVSDPIGTLASAVASRESFHE